MIDPLSPAQCVGYIALVLGVTAFLQKTDKRLKFFNAAESLVYFIHFLMLGNPSASATSLVSSVRTFASIKAWPRAVSATIIVLNIGLNIAFGTILARTPGGWLPVAGSCIATLAVFVLRGIPLRLMLLASTLCWLANNILSGSVGGTLLEALIALTNIATIVALTRARLTRARPATPAKLSPCSPAQCPRHNAP